MRNDAQGLQESSLATNRIFAARRVNRGSDGSGDGSARFLRAKRGDLAMRNRLLRRGVWCAAAAAVALGLAAAGSRTADAAGMLIADGGFGGVLEIKEHAARVTINNGVAVTEVE